MSGDAAGAKRNGRTNGERLFEPSLLILRCFLRALGREPSPPLLIRGVDDRDALAGDPALIRQVTEWSRDIVRPGAPAQSHAPMDSPCH